MCVISSCLIVIIKHILSDFFPSWGVAKTSLRDCRRSVLRENWHNNLLFFQLHHLLHF